MKAVLILLSLFAPQLYAMGGSIVGNGGHVVYCAQQTPQVQLLDFFEARSIRGAVIREAAGETYLDKIKSVLANLEDQALAKELLQQAVYFEHQTKFVSGEKLTLIPDSHHLTIPEGCEDRQGSIYRNALFPGERDFTVDKDLWDAMPANDKAGLVLHELAYRAALRGPNPPSDSTLIRVFVSNLFTGK